MARKGTRSNVTKMKPGSTKGKAALGRLKSDTKKGPRSQVLPGHEKIRSKRMDGITEDIAEGLGLINRGQKMVATGKAQAMKALPEEGLNDYTNAGVKVRFDEGVDKISVKLVKDSVNVGGEPKKNPAADSGDAGRAPSNDDPQIH